MFRHLFNAATAGLMVAVVATSAQANDLATSRALHEEGLALTAHIEDVSRQIQFHANRLSDLARSTSVSRESHIEHLETTMGLLRQDLLPKLRRLEAIQDSLPDWKQKSVQQLRESADRVTAHLAAALKVTVTEPRVAPALNAAYQVHVSAATRHVETLIATSDATSSYLLGRLKVADLSLLPLVG